MKIRMVVLLGVALLGAVSSAAEPANPFEYVSPRPGARLVPRTTTIILRPRAPRAGSLSAVRTTDVRGSVSGPHAGDWVVAEGGDTQIFRPREPFAPGESVSVTLGVEDVDFTFHFEVSPKTVDLQPERTARCGVDRTEVPARFLGTRTFPAPRGGLTLPEFFPAFTVTILDNPAPGYVLAAPRPRNGGVSTDYAVMLDGTAHPAFFRELPHRPGDFKRQKNANLYSYRQDNDFHLLNDGFELLDVFTPQNGYPNLDPHDFQVAPNGNVLLGIVDLQTIDMSQVVPGGDPNAVVQGFVMQEQDPSHNVVFQWRSWDHFEITEACGVDLTAPFVDYAHFNAFDYDTDGNILVSFRDLCEISKIDRQTGDVLWRMGGSQNEFTLVGDTRWFERQHSVRRTSAGTVTIFDNGALGAPWVSRVVEYDLDEVNKVATLAWQFVDDPPSFAGYGSNAQRLPNGNTLINWAPLGTITEVRSDGTKAFEMVSDDQWTYRAFRFEWNGVAARPELWFTATPSRVTLYFDKFGDPAVAEYRIYRDVFPNPVTQVGATSDNTFTFDVQWPEVFHVRVTAADSMGQESPFSNEFRITVPSAVDAPVVGASSTRFDLLQNQPNPFAPSTTISFLLPDSELASLAVYDVRGRLVRSLARGVMSPGLNEVVWDGTDGRGRRVGSGVYFYRLSAGGRELTKRMALLR